MIFTVRNVIAGILSGYLIVSGKVRKSIKKLKDKDAILSIYFHNPSLNTFLNCIKWLEKKGYSFISVKDLIHIQKGEKLFPSAAALITVDDGWSNNKRNIVWVANEKKIPVCIFAATDPVEKGEAFWWSYIAAAKREKNKHISVEALKKIENHQREIIVEKIKGQISLSREALTQNELYEISRSEFITIGSHTVSHPILPMCSDEEARYEITESKKKLETLVHKPIDQFAYPNGDFSDREINMLRDAGYSIAFSTKTLYLTPETLKKNYSIPRFEILDNTSMLENICRMTGVWFFNNPFKKK